MSISYVDAKLLIDEFGVPLTFTSVGTPTYDTDTGSVTTTDTDATVQGYFYNYKISDMTSPNVSLGDRKLVIYPFDTSGVSIETPKKGDTISGVDDLVYIKSIMTIRNGSSVVMYCLGVSE